MKEKMEEQLEQTMNHAKMELHYMKDHSLQIIVDRYEQALNTLKQKGEKKLSSEDFCIWGCIPIYLSALQDFTNPLVPELSQSEKLLTTYLNNQS